MVGMASTLWLHLYTEHSDFASLYLDQHILSGYLYLHPDIADGYEHAHSQPSNLNPEP